MSKKRTIAFLKRMANKNPGLSKTQASTVRKIAKNVQNKQVERKVFGFLDENRQLIHNKGDYQLKFLECKQGVEDPNDLSTTRLVRIGDEFFLRDINIRLWLSNKKDRPNVMYKCYLFWYDVATTIGDAQIFFTQQNKMLDRINNEYISVIDQKTIFSGASYAQTEHEHSYLCTLKGRWKNRKIIYDEGGTDPRKRDIGMCVVAYDAFGTLQTDNIASYAYNANLTIQDP